MKKEKANIYSTFAVMFYINRQKVKKNGLCPLMGRITVNAEVAQFSTKMDVPPEQWDAKAYRLTGKDRHARETNHKIDRLEKDIRRYHKEILDEQEYISAELIKNAVNGVGQCKRTLLELHKEHIENMERLVGITKAKGTVESQKFSYKTLSSFLRERYGMEDIPLKQLDYSFIEQYDNHLRIDKGYTVSTIESLIIMLKTMTRLAMEQGTIRSNPFAAFKPEKPEKQHRYLEMEELQRLMDTPVEKEFLRFTRDMFVFSSFTGISYADMVNLNEGNVSVDGRGRMWIRLDRQKTKSECIIQVLDIPRRIMEKYRKERKSDRIFNMPAYSTICENLKKLAVLCGIRKRLTYHMSRHNFGTLVTLSQGVPLETVCKMMGHKNMSTTQIYARLTSQKVNEDFKKLNSRIGDKFHMPDWNKSNENIKDIHYGQEYNYTK